MICHLNRYVVLAVVSCALLLPACSSSVDNDPDVGPTTPSSGSLPGTTAPVTPASGLRALFQVAAGVLPYPTDLYFSGSTDGTLNIAPANPLVPAQSALNALDGFGTNSVIRARFSAPVAASSLTPASVRVVQVNIDNTTKATVGVAAVLTPGVDYSVGLATDAGVGNTVVEIRPLKPLVPSAGATNRGYLVLMTNGITSPAGAPAIPDTDYSTIKAALAGGAACPTITNPTLNGVCRLTGAHLQIAQGVGIDPANVVLSFSFSTQGTRDTLNVLAQPAGAPGGTTAGTFSVQATGLTTTAVNPGLQGKANLLVGTFTIPYYLTRPSQGNPTAALTTFWRGAVTAANPNGFLTRFAPVPIATGSFPVPVLVTVPNAAAAGGGVKPPSGWPVLIFQHGLTRTRLDAVAVADSFADAGYVVVSIDLPLHGIAVTTNPFYQAANERTFNLDLVNNSTLAAGPDGTIDGSGTHFVNLTSLLTTRDNLRQGAVDLLALARSLPALSVDGDAVADVDATRIHFLGHSLGGIVGGVLLGSAGPAEIRTGVLANAGGGIAQTIIDSPAFGPRIVAGLSAQGLTPGSTLFAQFIRDAQTVVESGDPVNYIAAATTARPTLLFQVVGGGSLPAGGTSLPDQVVVNSSTQRLIAAANIPRIVPPGAAQQVGYVNFVLGEHGSLIDPTSSLATTVEMQTEAIVFSSTLGSSIVITNAAVVQP